MSTQKIKEQPTIPKAHDEKILVVKRTEIMPDGPWNGLKQVDFEAYLTIIDQKKQFLWRSQMEQDTSYKQIIPYLVFTHNDKYFLMQRRSTASETRLQSKYSLGIGGHIRQEDMTCPSIFEWARREFHEEVSYDGSFKIEPLGVLNDDSNAVGEVHIGFVLLLRGDSDVISVRSELKSGNLMEFEQCRQLYGSMENWSQTVFDMLAKSRIC